MNKYFKMLSFLMPLTITDCVKIGYIVEVFQKIFFVFMFVFLLVPAMLALKGSSSNEADCQGLFYSIL